MLRVLTLLLGGVFVCLALQGCDWFEECDTGTFRCNRSTLEECELAPNGFPDWIEIADCTDIDASCVMVHGTAWCEYGLR